jgi:hypothetical protein
MIMESILNLALFILIFPFFGIACGFMLIGDIFRSLGNTFGMWFLPGLMMIVYGVLFVVFGQPDPSVPFETLIQSLASSKLFGIPLPVLLIVSGIICFPVGFLLNVKRRSS